MDDLYDADKLNEALDFFKLDKLFTWDDLQDVYKPMARDNHPDTNGKSKEDNMKKINAHKTTLQQYEMKNRSYLHEQLEIRKKDFFEKLNSDKNRYNLDAVTNLVNTYKTLINGITGFNRLKKLKDEYNKKLNTILLSHEKKEIFNLNQRKEAFKKYFVYKYTKCSRFLNLDNTLTATQILSKVLELIKKAEKNDIDDLIKKLNDISFSDLENDLNIIKKINSKYSIYINKNTGSLVYVDSVGEIVKYRKNLNDELTSCNYDKFKHDYISLERFLFESVYVGDKKVRIFLPNSVREDLPLSRYLFYHERTGLMLVYKEMEIVENFIFYGENKKDYFGNYSTHFEISSIKRDDVNGGMFRDKEFVYQKIMEQTSKVSQIKLDNGQKNGIELGIERKPSHS